MSEINFNKINLDSLANKILENLNSHARNIVTGISLSSPRAVGDAVQEYLANKGLPMILNEYNIKIKNDFTRRSIEDIAFNDNNGNYYAIDVKTHNTKTDFNMPNLISIRRLSEFYKTDTNYFCILIVSYHVNNNCLEFTDCNFKPIEEFDWKCLTFGALGWGQIQISNANNIMFNTSISRKEWMYEMYKRIDNFYNNEEKKINERRKWFKNLFENYI